MFCFLFLLVNQPFRQSKILTLDNSSQNILYFHKSAHSKYVTVKVNKGYTWCRFGKNQSYGYLQVCSGTQAAWKSDDLHALPPHLYFSLTKHSTKLDINCSLQNCPIWTCSLGILNCVYSKNLHVRVHQIVLQAVKSCGFTSRWANLPLRNSTEIDSTSSAMLLVWLGPDPQIVPNKFSCRWIYVNACGTLGWMLYIHIATLGQCNMLVYCRNPLFLLLSHTMATTRTITDETEISHDSNSIIHFASIPSQTLIKHSFFSFLEKKQTFLELLIHNYDNVFMRVSGLSMYHYFRMICLDINVIMTFN